MSDTLSGIQPVVIRPISPTIPAIPDLWVYVKWLVASGLFVAGAELLVVPTPPGLGLALFGLLALGLQHAVSRPKTWSRFRVLLVGLIALSLAQTAVYANFENGVCLALLFSTLMVEEEARKGGFLAAAPWVGVFAWPPALGRWFLLIEAGLDHLASLKEHTSTKFWVRPLWILLPGVLIVLPIALLLSAGNAILGQQLTILADYISKLVFALHLPSIQSVLRWVVIGTFALVFLKPRIAKVFGAALITPWLPLQKGVSRELTYPRTLVTMALANGVFLWANATDMYYLWFHSELPAHLSHSEYVHQGVFSLVLAALLSAGILTWLTHQDASINEKPLPRLLVALWMFQAVLLVISVGLRLKLYIDDYQLTLLRCYVVPVLIAMAIGFGLLTYKVFAGRSLNWLAHASAVTCFLLFFCLQFVDLSGYIARKNTDDYLRGTKAEFNFGYLHELGYSAMPAIADLALHAPTPEVRNEAKHLLLKQQATLASESTGDWRAFQLRAYLTSQKLAEMPPVR